jgi:predicted Rossmann fold nucleotide-binding protein DprA/Smf involved in DNA uptake
MKTMSEDAKTILLLCGHLGGDNGVEPLNQRDYNNVVRWLLENKLRPADLLADDIVPDLARGTGLEEQRLLDLLKRGVKLGFAVEKWNQSGIWVICRSDPDYPARYRTHLKEKAPPILFGAGERSLLQGGGLAIVGSRDVDATGEVFARKVAERCARAGMPVVSGGARGVDQIAMLSALENGGIVLGILADSLLRRSVARDARDALADGRLLLISPYHPEAGFNVGNAMGRNKFIYALAEYGLVVRSDYLKGGTWEGAKEELKQDPGRPVFVRSEPNVPRGNQELLKMGALAFPSDGLTENLRDALEKAIRTTAIPQILQFEPMIDTPKESATQPVSMQVETKYETQRQDQPAMVREPSPALSQPIAPVPCTVLEAVKPLILRALDKPRTVQDMAKVLNIRKPQAQDWVKALITEGILTEQIKRKVKKLSIRKREEELPL